MPFIVYRQACIRTLVDLHENGQGGSYSRVQPSDALEPALRSHEPDSTLQSCVLRVVSCRRQRVSVCDPLVYPAQPL